MELDALEDAALSAAHVSPAFHAALASCVQAWYHEAERRRDVIDLEVARSTACVNEALILYGARCPGAASATSRILRENGRRKASLAFANSCVTIFLRLHRHFNMTCGGERSGAPSLREP